VKEEKRNKAAESFNNEKPQRTSKKLEITTTIHRESKQNQRHTD